MNATVRLPAEAGSWLRDGYQRIRTKRVAQLIALTLAVVAMVLVALIPTYTEITTTSEGIESTSRATLVQVNGLSVLFVLAIPVATAALPLLARGRVWQPLSIVSATLLLGFAVLGLATIGSFVLPAAIAAIAGAFLPAHGATRMVRSPGTGL